MKRMMITTIAALAAAAASATPVPDAHHEDTERRIHLPMPPLDGKTTLRITLAFTASPSNSLTAAIGPDTDNDGRLSLREQDAEFGWDGAEWFIRRRAPDGQGWHRYAWPAAAGERALDAALGLAPARPHLTLTAAGATLARLDAEDWLPAASLPDALIRVTARGVNVAGTAEVTASTEGTLLILR